MLAYFPSPPRGVWHLGPVPIRAYALFIIVGIVVALMIGDRRWEARGGERGIIYDIALYAVPSGLIGGRLYHLATDWRTYFGEGGAGLGAAVRVWDGGLGIWGAVALGVVGAWFGCRRRGIPLPAFGDAVAPGIVLAQAIGRLGNYFNQELFGRETTMPWGLEIFNRGPYGCGSSQPLDGVSTGQVCAVVQPTFLYELLWNVLVFVMLIYIDRRFKIGHGRLFALYVAGYCVGRFWIELLRDDVATHIAGIRVNSFTSTFVFIGAVVYFILAAKGREDPATLGGARAAEPEVEPEPTSELVTAAAPAAATEVTEADEPTRSVEAATDSARVIEPEEAEAPEELEVEEPETGEAAAEEVEPEEAEAEESETEEAEEPEVGDVESETHETEDVAEEAEPDELAADTEAEEPVAQAPEPTSSTPTGWRSRLRRVTRRSGR
ncbi:prolipoprotein diacylglyceryl transferase [Mycobacterium sp.]|uniref:prolipoprotein diacylglyceryl transferase n=1 Tax=Mycobacterium sp. TaxID=1785 RepID=UPI003D6BFF83